MENPAIERLMTFLKERGISDSKCAQAIGASRATVNRWWHGSSPQMDHLIALFNAYNDLDPHWLFFGTAENIDSPGLEKKGTFSFEYVERLRNEHKEEVMFLRKQVEFMQEQLKK